MRISMNITYKNSKNSIKNSIIMAVLIMLFSVLFSSVSLAATSQEFNLEKNAADSGFIYYAPKEISRPDALNALLAADNNINDMKNNNLTVLYLNDLLVQARQDYIGYGASNLKSDISKEKSIIKLNLLESMLEMATTNPLYGKTDLNYSEVLMLSELIKFRKDQANNILDSLSLIKEKEIKYLESGADTSAAAEALKKAETAFNEERYDESEAAIRETDLKLEEAMTDFRRSRDIMILSKNFITRYWWQLSVLLAAIIISAPFMFKRIRIRAAKMKIKSLKAELEGIDDLLKNAQIDYLKKRTLTKETYEIMAEGYKRRSTEINHTLPVYESIARGEKHDKKKSGKEKQEGALEFK